MSKRIFLLLFAFTFSTKLFSQNDSINEAKYWHYRDRLKYFVLPGENRGESQIAGIRNRFEFNTVDLNFGQHAIYFGYYIGMLATEYKLLSENNDNKCLSTKNELYLALKQYINYLDKTESIIFKNLKDSFNGFFVRESVPCDFLEKESRKEYFNNGLKPTDTWSHSNPGSFGNLPKGHPGWVNIVSECDSIPKAMSQDEAIGLLYGLALVYKCMPDNSLEKYISKEIAIKIIGYIRNSSRLYGKNTSLRWNVYRPNGDKLKANEGGLSWFYAHGFMKAANYFDNDYDNISKKITRYPQELFFQLGQFFPNPNPDNTTMITTLAVVGNSWRATIPIIGLIFNINTTYFGINAKTYKQDWDTFYILSWEVLHDKRRKMDERLLKTLNQLNNAPYEGPYNYYYGVNPKGSGWSSSYRWHHKKDMQLGDVTGIGGNYNGLDYMLLYNLYNIVKNSKTIK